MDIIVYLCGMNFTSQIRHNPKTGRDDRYYRLKESYRNALGHSCTRILLNVGFVDDLLPEEMRDISRALTYKYEHQDDTELWPDPLCVYSDRVRERALEYWGEIIIFIKSPRIIIIIIKIIIISSIRIRSKRIITI